VAGLALEDDLGARLAGDRGDDADRHVLRLEHRALLDVDLDVTEQVVRRAPRGVE
jgi:hypothetical protein